MSLLIWSPVSVMPLYFNIKYTGLDSSDGYRVHSGEAYMSTVNLDDGEGYISYDGVAYINVKEKQDCNLCIKAFSDNR